MHFHDLWRPAATKRWLNSIVCISCGRACYNWIRPARFGPTRSLVMVASRNMVPLGATTSTAAGAGAGAGRAPRTVAGNAAATANRGDTGAAARSRVRMAGSEHDAAFGAGATEGACTQPEPAPAARTARPAGRQSRRRAPALARQVAAAGFASGRVRVVRRQESKKIPMHLS